MRHGWIALLLGAFALAAPPRVRVHAQHQPPGGGSAEPSTGVELVVDAAVEHQRFDGFGASHMVLWYDGGAGDVLGGLRAQALDAVYAKLRLTIGNVDAALLESPAGWDERRNDNDDPFRIDTRGFQSRTSEAFERLVLQRPEARGFTRPYPAPRINSRWASPWLAELRSRNYGAYLDEAAEQVLAEVRDWRARYGASPEIVQLFNEPTSGNVELPGAGARDLVDIIKRTGARLRSEGFDGVRFVVPNEETVDRTLDVSREILDDPQARALVGAIAYHPYPYESAYANIPRLLEDADQGRKDPSSVSARRGLRALAERYQVPLWMTEVSNGGVDIRSHDALRGRANHIHDEFVEAGASAFFGMQSLWDLRSHELHFGSGAGFYTHEGPPVVVDQDRGEVIVTGMGGAMGHYARWLSPGAIRLEARSDDDRVRVTAFRDGAQGRLVLVVINNRRGPSTARVRLSGVSPGRFSGEQSTAAAMWQPLDTRASGSAFELTVPAHSVTTLSAGLDGSAASSPR